MYSGNTRFRYGNVAEEHAMPQNSRSPTDHRRRSSRSHRNATAKSVSVSRATVMTQTFRNKRMIFASGDTVQPRSLAVRICRPSNENGLRAGTRNGTEAFPSIENEAR